jgi:copper resistance protein B
VKRIVGALGGILMSGVIGGNTARGQEADTQQADTQQAEVPAAHAQDRMTYREMADLMQMDDTARFGKVMLDQVEWRGGGATGDARAAWDVQGWYGGDYDKLWVKSEGNYVGGGSDRPARGIQDASVELLWDRVIARWWSLQAGGREDLAGGPARTWAAVGVQGLAPQWFETEATFYVGTAGRTAARLKAQYDLLLTQRLVLQPFAEANLYGRSDVSRQIGSGLSNLELSVRLRYEIRRELAPYIGFAWLRRVGSTADLVRAAGDDAGEFQVVAGLRVWF